MPTQHTLPGFKPLHHFRIHWRFDQAGRGVTILLRLFEPKLITFPPTILRIHQLNYVGALFRSGKINSWVQSINLAVVRLSEPAATFRPDRENSIKVGTTRLRTESHQFSLSGPKTEKVCPQILRAPFDLDGNLNFLCLRCLGLSQGSYQGFFPVSHL